MLAEQRLREGKLDDTLELLQTEVRARPDDVRLRVFLFQLLALMGNWDRAVKQLQVAGQLDPSALGMAQAYREVLRCEALRTEVFLGRRAPMFLGEPPAWMALLIEALRLESELYHAQADALRGEALDTASSRAGVLNGTAYEWIADGDSRLGPTLEVFLRGRYYWLPFSSVMELEVEPPSDLRDLVWLPARLTLEGTEALPCFIPTRYIDTHLGSDELRLSRRTEWREPGPHTIIGLGQRTLFTNLGECALLDLRTLNAEASEPVESPRDA
ncbi:MAG TPA: type VI secretion system accessory protein TagJ [Polyangiales bacterium]